MAAEAGPFAIQARLDKPIEMPKADAVPFKDFARQFADLTGVKLLADPRSKQVGPFESRRDLDEALVSFDFAGPTRAEVVLDSVLAQIEVKRLVRRDHVALVGGDRFMAEVRADRYVAQEYQDIPEEEKGPLAAAMPLLTADYAGKTMRQALEDAAERGGVNLVMPEALAKQLDGQPAGAKFVNVPAEAAVTTLLRAAGVGYDRSANVIRATADAMQ